MLFPCDVPVFNYKLMERLPFAVAFRSPKLEALFTVLICLHRPVGAQAYSAFTAPVFFAPETHIMSHFFSLQNDARKLIQTLFCTVYQDRSQSSNQGEVTVASTSAIT